MLIDFRVAFDEDTPTLIKKAKATMLLKAKSSSDYKEAEKFLKEIKEEKEKEKRSKESKQQKRSAKDDESKCNIILSSLYSFLTIMCLRSVTCFPLVNCL